MSKGRTLAAWQKGDKFYLSGFRGGAVHANGETPAAEFDSEAELLAEVRRRRVNIDWEYKEPEEDKPPVAVVHPNGDI